MNRATQPAELVKAANWQPFNPRRLVELLWPKAAQQLSRAELLAIIDGGTDYTTEAAHNAAKLAEGVACLVAHDGAEGAGAGTGSFQDAESVASLLFNLQGQFEALAAVSSAVGFAASELTVRDNP